MVQKQGNSHDCGLHAVANLVEVLFGGDPQESSYGQLSMRQHLHDCLAQGRFSVFPKVDVAMPRFRRTTKVTWYRVCRIINTTSTHFRFSQKFHILDL